MSSKPDNCYPGYWIVKIRESKYTPEALREDPRKVEKLALSLAAFNSLSPIGSRAIELGLKTTNTPQGKETV